MNVRFTAVDEQRSSEFIKGLNDRHKVNYFLMVFYPWGDSWQFIGYSKSILGVLRKSIKYLKLNCSIKIFSDKDFVSNFSFSKVSYPKYDTGAYKEFFVTLDVKESEMFKEFENENQTKEET